MKKKVIVGLSGGVDSSAAAFLLKQEGYDVIGVTMLTWPPAEPGGEDAADHPYAPGTPAADAKRVADAIGIPHHVADLRDEFRTHVVRYFMEEYLLGRTPNPCVVCNRFVKWEALLTKSAGFGASLAATGHYARIARTESGRYAVRTSKTAAKDQTYALYRLTQDQLSRTIMPNGEYTKDEIRLIAERAGIPTAHKPDSQEICFIPDNDYAGFIERHSGRRIPEGRFVTADGRDLGPHSGITHYTVGQRKGLGLAMGRPVFVKEIRPDTNEVVIGEAGDVFSSVLTADRLNWMAVDGLHGKPLRALAKIRYGHAGSPCVITEADGGAVRVEFDSPVRAVTPGQACVFYDADGLVLGGGTIMRSGPACGTCAPRAGCR